LLIISFSIGSPETERISLLKSLVHQLPERNFATLTHLLRFFQRFFQFSNDSKMTPESIAIVFGPNIIRDQTIDPQKMVIANDIMLLLLQFTSDIIG
jgi:hypothetical protein